MAAYIKVCDGDCAASGPSCGVKGGCPTDYFCSSVGFEYANDENKETACLRGICINADGQEDGTLCSRCDAGYAIVLWDDSMKGNKNSDNCEFITDDCPRFCPDYFVDDSLNEALGPGKKCNDNPGFCGCQDIEIECTDIYGMSYLYLCAGSARNVCQGLELDGVDYIELITGRPKNTSSLKPKDSCCGCGFCSCPGACPGSCTVDTDCPQGKVCGLESGSICPVCKSPF
jgi:hypothetical protein